MQDKKSKFLKTYANLPLPSRQEIVVVIDGEPLTWNIVKLEVENDTPKGQRAIEILEQLGILKVENVTENQSDS